MKKSLLMLIILISSIILAQGQVINVPGDQQTIQGAINASVDGDTVLVADGTYYENIDYRGKAITVASHFLTDADETHIDNTIINGSQPSHLDSASVVAFQSGEDTTSVLYGFTVTGGTGGYRPVHFVHGAGGVLITYSGAKILHNKIISNTVSHWHPFGGGIVVDSPTNAVIIKNNLIAYNVVTSIGSNAIQSGGGGIFCVYDSLEYILIANNIISDNSVINTINDQWSFGGGIGVHDCKPIPEIRNNLIKNNFAREGGGISFGGSSSSNELRLANNTIVNNVARYDGGGLYKFSGWPGTIESINSIIWGNTAQNNYSQVFNVGVNYSNVNGYFGGTGNINLEPLFADIVNYYLSSTSPCIDAGHPNIIYNDVEDPLNLGFALSPSLGGLRNDMGAYGGNPGMLSATTISTEDEMIPQLFKLEQNFPNPFNPTTTIKYMLPEDSQVNITVYNMLGKEIYQLLSLVKPAGSHSVQWNGKDSRGNPVSAGIYLFQIQAGNFVQTKKMVLMK